MGDLTIRVLEASNLIPADRNGKSDPYVTVEILEDPMQKKQKTHCHHKTLNPVWQETFNFRAPTPTSTILFKVWDRDLFSRNDPLGNFNVQVNRLSANVPNNMWLDLQGVPHGKLHVEIIYIPRVQAGGQQPVSQPYQQAQQPGYPPQGYPPQNSSQGGYPNTYGSNPTQSYPNTPRGGPVTSYPNPTASYPNTNSGYPTPSPVNSSTPYSSNPPTSLYQQPPPPTSSYQPPPTSSYQQPPPPTSSYRQPPTSSYQQPIDDDVATDYSKLANDFAMGVNISSQPNSYPPQTNYPQQPGNYPPTSSYSAPPQQSSYPPTSSYGAPPQQSSYPQPGYPPQQSGYPPQQSGYPPQQAGGYPPQQSGAYPNIQKGPMVTAQGLMQGPKLTKFFVDIRKKLNRDYIVIMDMSGSMSGSRWEQAKQATMQIAPFACQADPDGITLYLFNGRYSKFEHLVSAQQVQAIFMREKPSGTTDLAGVLRAAFQEHFSGNKPTTILVITDGEPDSQAATTREIVQASKRVNSEEDLSVSFIQIGTDRSATKFLKFLDDSLRPQGARFDIVDTVSASDLGSMSFEQLIQKSIYD